MNENENYLLPKVADFFVRTVVAIVLKRQFSLKISSFWISSRWTNIGKTTRFVSKSINIRPIIGPRSGPIKKLEILSKKCFKSLLEFYLAIANPAFLHAESIFALEFVARAIDFFSWRNVRNIEFEHAFEVVFRSNLPQWDSSE